MSLSEVEDQLSAASVRFDIAVRYGGLSEDFGFSLWAAQSILTHAAAQGAGVEVQQQCRAFPPTRCVTRFFFSTCKMWSHFRTARALISCFQPPSPPVGGFKQKISASRIAFY
jgi:hypothetical protein